MRTSSLGRRSTGRRCVHQLGRSCLALAVGREASSNPGRGSSARRPRIRPVYDDGQTRVSPGKHDVCFRYFSQSANSKRLALRRVIVQENAKDRANARQMCLALDTEDGPAGVHYYSQRFARSASCVEKHLRVRSARPSRKGGACRILALACIVVRLASFPLRSEGSYPALAALKNDNLNMSKFRLVPGCR